MFNDIKKFTGEQGYVWKYVFTCDDAVSEAVLYKYESFTKRTVMCVSVMSGCPVGCQMCGTGKKFIRNLTKDEIVQQVKHLVYEAEQMEGINTSLNTRCEKFQIMFMSMGEPMLNWLNVETAIVELNDLYPNADLLISTVGIDNMDVMYRMGKLSQTIDKVGLQFSIHEALEDNRNELIPYKNKLSLRQIRDYGCWWNNLTKRPVYLNYCLSGTNMSAIEKNRLMDLFPTGLFNFTFSVICSSNETMKEVGNKNLAYINSVSNEFTQAGYNCRVFDPAGQDDIGGGCGQLWYVQQWMKEKGLKK